MSAPTPDGAGLREEVEDWLASKPTGGRGSCGMLVGWRFGYEDAQDDLRTRLAERDAEVRVEQQSNQLEALQAENALLRAIVTGQSRVTGPRSDQGESGGHGERDGGAGL